MCDYYTNVSVWLLYECKCVITIWMKCIILKVFCTCYSYYFAGFIRLCTYTVMFTYDICTTKIDLAEWYQHYFHTQTIIMYYFKCIVPFTNFKLVYTNVPFILQWPSFICVWYIREIKQWPQEFFLLQSDNIHTCFLDVSYSTSRLKEGWERNWEVILLCNFITALHHWFTGFFKYVLD